MTEKQISRVISRIYRQNLRFFYLKLREYELPLEVGHIPVIMQVYRNPGITQDGISANAHLDKGTTARCLKQLEETGVIRRETDAVDRRVNHIYSTDEGLKMKPEVFQIIEELHAVLYSGMSDEEIDGAVAAAKRMMANMNECLGDICRQDKI